MAIGMCEGDSVSKFEQNPFIGSIFKSAAIPPAPNWGSGGQKVVSQQPTVGFWWFFHRFSSFFKCKNCSHPPPRSNHSCIAEKLKFWQDLKSQQQYLGSTWSKVIYLGWKWHLWLEFPGMNIPKLILFLIFRFPQWDFKIVFSFG